MQSERKLPLAFADRALSRRGFLKAAASVSGLLPAAGSVLSWPARSMAFPPDPFFENVARMVYHENPWGPHPAAAEAVRTVLGKGASSGGINRFQDPVQEDLKRAILRYNRVDGILGPEHVILGVGSSEVLFMAADAFTSAARPLLTEWITYRIIIQRAEQNKALVVKVPLRPDWQTDLARLESEVIAASAGGTPYGLIHFNLINNPAGTFLHKESFDAFARSVYRHSPDSVILCDDSDREFMEPDKRDELFEPLRHVVEGLPMLHVQTFSHIFGLTGLRIGYGIARRDIIERMEAHKIYSGTNAMARAAALASLAHADEQVQRCNTECCASRAWLYDQLDAMGLEYLPSQGHYILINLGTMDGTLAVLLLYLTHKVFVRWGSEWGMESWIRVNPGTPYENERFITGLKAILDRGPHRVSWQEYAATTEGARLAQAAVRHGFPRHALGRACRSAA
jgi:histidinol-phosphate aminotransferase